MFASLYAPAGSDSGRLIDSPLEDAIGLACVIAIFLIFYVLTARAAHPLSVLLSGKPRAVQRRLYL